MGKPVARCHTAQVQLRRESEAERDAKATLHEVRPPLVFGPYHGHDACIPLYIVLYQGRQVRLGGVFGAVRAVVDINRSQS